jgi:hypothetical protein
MVQTNSANATDDLGGTIGVVEADGAGETRGVGAPDSMEGSSENVGTPGGNGRKVHTSL